MKKNFLITDQNTTILVLGCHNYFLFKNNAYFLPDFYLISFWFDFPQIEEKNKLKKSPDF